MPEIIMNGNFVEHIRDSYEKISNKKQFQEVNEILGPWPVKLKGFKHYVNIYKLIKS